MGRPRKTEVDSQKEVKTNQEVQKKKKAPPVNKTREDASGFRTTLPPEHVYKIKVTTSQGERVIVTDSVSRIVNAIKDAKQDSKKIKIDPDKVIKSNPRMVQENFYKAGKSILHKLKDATLSFFRGFKK
jgi:hypothetical protein